MGFPLALAAALLATGTGLTIAGQQQQRRANQAAQADYARRLDEIGQRSDEVFQQALDGSDAQRAQQTIDAEAQLFQREVQTLSDEQPFAKQVSAGQASAPRVVRNENARQLANELARARSQIAAQAKLEGFTQRNTERANELGRSTESQIFLGLDGRRAGNIFAADQLDAQSAGSNLQLAGTMVAGLGSVGLGSALGAGAAAGAAANTYPAATAAGSIYGLSGIGSTFRRNPSL